MITEIRYIVFDESELCTAMAEHLASVLPGIDGTSVERVEPQALGQDITACTVSFRRAAGQPPIRVEPKVVVSAMLTRCRRLKIPIAAAAEKRLERAGSSLAMVTTINALRPTRRR